MTELTREQMEINEMINEKPIELYKSEEYRDDALANIFNSTNNRDDLYSGIIHYLTEVGFLHDGEEETPSEDIVEKIMKECSSNYIIEKYLSDKNITHILGNPATTHKLFQIYGKVNKVYTLNSEDTPCCGIKDGALLLVTKKFKKLLSSK